MLDFSSIAADSTAELTVPLPSKLNDIVLLGIPNASMPAGIMYNAFVSVANTVTIRCYNTTGSPIDPDSGTFNVAILK